MLSQILKIQGTIPPWIVEKIIKDDYLKVVTLLSCGDKGTEGKYIFWDQIQPLHIEAVPLLIFHRDLKPFQDTNPICAANQR